MQTPTLGGWLVHVMKESDGALSLEESLHVIMDSMKTYFPCQSVALILIDEESKQLRIKISRQISYTFVKQFHRDGPSPIAERVVLEQRPMLFNGVAPGSPLQAQLRLEHDLSAAVMAPIIREQRGVGYIFCDRAGGASFTDADLLHLQVVGYLIGHLMEKFDLLRERKALSPYDDASGALQYKAFVPALAAELERSRAHGYPLTLALLSVDAFRRYVEQYGVRTAHELLAEVVRAVRKRIHEMDVLARFSADEFVLLLSGQGAAEAPATLAAIAGAVRSEVVGRGGGDIRITAGAVTLATEPEKRVRPQDLLAALGRQAVQAKSANDGSILFGPVLPEPPVA